MSILIAIVATVTTGVIGLLCTALLASFCVSWYGISSFEGGSGYFVAGLALLGGCLGLITGLIASLVGLYATERFTGWSAVLLAWGVAIAALLVATGLAWLFATRPPFHGGRHTTLEVEAMLPESITEARATLGDESLVAVVGRHLGVAGKAYGGEVDLEHARREGDRWIVPVLVHVHISDETAKALERDAVETPATLVLRRLLLASREHADGGEWSEWVPTDAPATELICRCRPKAFSAMSTAAEPPSIDTLVPDAPLSEWLPFAVQSIDPAASERAMAAIVERPELGDELLRLSIDDDPESAALALRTVARLPGGVDAWSPLLVRAGTEIVDRIERFNATPIEDDPSYLGAADVSVRFSAWIETLRLLRAQDPASLDAALAPSLLRILHLSRHRPESIAMRQDVCRVASYYAHEWIGTPPDPGDPPPR